MDARIALCVFAAACALLASASGQNVAESSEKYNVTMEAINSAYQTLDSERTNFTFSCSVHGPNGTVKNPTFSLMISGDDGGKKSAKVTNRTEKTKVIFTYLITNHTDDQTVFACVYNSSNHPWPSRHNLTLTVFYAPVIFQPNVTMFHGDSNTSRNVTFKLMANPPVQSDFTWKMNGKKLSNSSSITVWPDTISFTPVLANVTGNYSVQDCNNVSCSSFSFVFTAYYAPRFAGDLANASLLTEVATGSSRNLTCTVVDYSGPLNLSLNLTTEPSTIPHLNYTEPNDSSIMVTITNASQSDTAAYVCLACCGNEPKYCSFLEFATYVGGPPSASAVNISCHLKTVGTQFNISCNVTDNNLAPITMLDFSMPGLDFNTTLYFNTTDQIPIDSASFPLFTGSLQTIFAGNYSLQVVAGNQLNTSVLVYFEDIYLAGLNNVTIQPVNSQNQTLGQGKDFNFNCSVNMENGTDEHPKITLAIFGGGNTTEKLAKVISNTVKHGMNFTYPITNYTDDQTIFVCQYNHNGHTSRSPNLTLIVFYGPQFAVANNSELHGDNGTNASVSIGAVANPPIKNYTWTMNGRNLSNSSNVTVTPGGLHFSLLLTDFVGNYSVQECNNVSCNNLTFPLVVYYAPLFAGNLRNASLLTEIATGQNRNLTCTVVDHSGPDALKLTLTNDIPPSKYKKKNASSITLMITNASQSDAMGYTFLACSGKQPQYCSYLNFSTFVGGPPNKSSLRIVNVTVSDSTDGKYNLTIVGNFTDNNQAPVTHLKFAINETGSSRNVSVQAPLKNVTQKVQSSELINSSQLKGESYIHVVIYAVNDLGSSSVATVKASLPLEPTASPKPTASTTPSPAKNNVGVIVVAVLVPLAFIVFLIAAAAGGYLYYKRHKHPKGFTRLVPNNDDPNDATDGVYDAT